MRVLVTGGAGFIGSHVCDRLFALGHEVLVQDDLSHGDRSRVRAGVHLEVRDVADPETPDWIVSQARPEVVYHLAAQMDVRKSMSDPAFDARTNVIGSLNVLEGARRAGARLVVFASTGGAIYGEGANVPVPTHEDAPAAPISVYGASKLAVEKYLGVYHAIYGLDFVALRFANVYGPRQDPHGEAGVVAIFCERLLAGTPCVINGDGRQTRDYVHVRDVAEACTRAMKLRGANVLNVGTGVETDVVELYGELARVAGCAAPATFAPARAGEQRRSAIDASRARALLDWTPTVTLAKGLADTYEWFAKRHASTPPPTTA
jgi:UDP-glucose 4-epimerase